MISGTLEILRGAEILNISDMVHYAVMEVDGFGAPPAHRITERGPLQHGESDRGYRLDPRLIQLVLNLRSSDWASHYAIRQELLDYLSPTEQISLRFTQPDGTVRQIDGFGDGPSYPSKDRRSSQFQRAAIRLACPDPAWYDPVRQSVRVVGGGGGTGFNFPMPVPWTFGGIDIDVEVALDYVGTWLEYPEIELTGPIENPRIENKDTTEVLEFGGDAIDNGESMIIDLRYGYKTIVDSASLNRIGDLTADSDLATWHLQPGSNTIGFSGVNTGANTSMILRWYNRYLGV